MLTMNEDEFLPESIVKELFGDVMFTVGVLERQIELVAERQGRVTLGLVVAWTPELPTLAVHVYGNVLTQLLDVLEATVGSDAVGHKPRHQTTLPCRVVDRRPSFHRGSWRGMGPFPGGRLQRAGAKTGERHVLIIRRDDSRVWTIRGLQLL